MRIVILTSIRRGTASFCLKEILLKTNVKVELVIFNEGIITNKWKYYRKKAKKVFQIGVLGALNGIRMRNWYSLTGVYEDLDDIETMCKKSGIRFETSPAINCKRTRELMQSAQPDLGLSLGNGYIGSKIFSIPNYGMLNIHGEVLPDFQNAQSVIWQLFEGNSVTGFTIHKIDNRIDTGDIVYQEKFTILFRDTLRKTIMATTAEILRRSAAGLVKVLNDFDHYFNNSFPQGKGRTYTTPGINNFMKIYRNYKRLRNQSSNN